MDNAYTLNEVVEGATYAFFSDIKKAYDTV